MLAGLLGRVSRVAAAFRVVTVTPMPARRGVAPLADVPDRQRRDGPPELVIRGKHPVVAVSVLSRRRHEVRQTIEKLKRREVDNAVGPPRSRDTSRIAWATRMAHPSLLLVAERLDRV